MDNLVATANMMADAARAAILPFFRDKTLVSTSKEANGFDPVTQADRAGEEAMRAVLAQHRPDDAILGEEFDTIDGTTGLTWVLDPIDGTRGFVSGTPTWGVLIALNDANGPLLGLIDQPYIGERFIGFDGAAEVAGPAGTATLQVLGDRPLEQATIFTTFPEVGTDTDGAAFKAVAEKCKLTRYGMDCYAYALLAAGHIDLVIEAGLQAYDICGPIGLIEAAGGIVTDWSGGPAHNGGRVVAAASQEQHKAALDILAQYVND
ncbi:histidinol-phosphatase [Algirhabdus cladophorae]|uniref:histidinol-phosphatase n=1 Tax=Algirhabdus cladophorae TaxID=3377108 RepID=UPI003B845BEE